MSSRDDDTDTAGSSSSDDALRLLAARLHNDRVARGDVDEATHQRCALRCWSQSLYPTPALEASVASSTCYERCLGENAIGGGSAPAPLSFASPPVIVLCIALVCVLLLRVMPVRCENAQL